MHITLGGIYQAHDQQAVAEATSPLDYMTGEVFVVLFSSISVKRLTRNRDLFAVRNHSVYVLRMEGMKISVR